jgi:hypothetical protein
VLCGQPKSRQRLCRCTGVSFIDFGRIKGAYDPQRGLLLTMPYALYDNETGGRGRMGTASVRIDLRGKGSVRIEQ